MSHPTRNQVLTEALRKAGEHGSVFHELTTALCEASHQGDQEAKAVILEAKGYYVGRLEQDTWALRRRCEDLADELARLQSEVVEAAVHSPACQAIRDRWGLVDTGEIQEVVS